MFRLLIFLWLLILSSLSFSGVTDSRSEAKSLDLHTAGQWNGPRLAVPDSAPQANCNGDTNVPGCGWVPAGPIEGGCRNPRECVSDVGPKISGLFEYVPDQEFADTEPWENGTWLAEHIGQPDYPTYVKREVCWYRPDSGRGSLPAAWPAGTWHHGAYWERVNGVWSRSRDHWAFFHNDTCDGPVGLPGDPGLPTTFPPTPTSTPTATSTPMATPRPGAIRITVWRCRQGEAGLDVSISAYAGSWTETRHGSSIEFSVPNGVTAVSWGLGLPPGWAADPDDGTTAVNSSVDVVATSPVCSATPTHGTGTVTPTPTMAWRPCTGSHGPRPFSIDLDVSGVPTHEAGGTRRFPFGNWLPTLPDPAVPTFPENTPLSITYDWGTLRGHDFAAGHTGFGRVRLAIWDQTAGKFRLDIDASRPEGSPPLPPDGWALTPKTIINDDLQLGGDFVWRRLNRAHGTWEDQTTMPKPNWFIRDTVGSTKIIFMPEPGHRYAIWSTAGHDACLVDFATWRIAILDVACEGEDCPPPPPGCPDGAPACPTGPTTPPPPTPVPPPPPAPPQAFGTVRLAMHSRYDPKHGGLNQMDGVHTSTGTTVTWPQGEILDFAPAVTLFPPPAAPVDPYWGRLYTFEQEILGWSYVTDQPCRGGATVREGLKGCTFAYLAAADENSLATQGHVMWSAGTVPTVPVNVFAHHLGTLAPVSLPVEVLVETRTLSRTGTVLARRQTVLSTTFRVELVAPRTVR